MRFCERPVVGPGCTQGKPNLAVATSYVDGLVCSNPYSNQGRQCEPTGVEMSVEQGVRPSQSHQDHGCGRLRIKRLQVLVLPSARSRAAGHRLILLLAVVQARDVPTDLLTLPGPGRTRRTAPDDALGS